MRVGSEKTRQALLQVGTAMETSPLPERLELFLEDGTPVDVGKDRTRARWRNIWTAAPDAPYEQNDFVMDDDKLWILSDASLVEETPVAPSASTSGAWALMTVGGGMKWLGEYDPDVDYEANSVIKHETGVYISIGNIESGSAEPGEPLADLAVVTVKAGDAMFGGHNQPARVLVKGQVVEPIPAQLGGEVNIGQDASSRFFKLAAVPNDVVTLHYEGGDISIFDGGGGDALFASGDASGTPDGPDLTFVVPSLSATHGDVPAYVVIEVGGDVTSLLWVSGEDVGGWDLIMAAGGSGGEADPIAFVDTLPSTPADGDEIYFQNSDMETLGAVWHLRYREASTSDYKWEFIGGSPLHIYDSAQGNTTNGSFVAIGSYNMVIPLDGEYTVDMSASLGLDNAGANKYAHMGVGVGGGVVPSGASIRRAGSASEAYGVDGRSLTTPIFEGVADDLIQPMLKQEGSVLAYLEQIKMSLKPIRVG